MVVATPSATVVDADAAAEAIADAGASASAAAVVVVGTETEVDVADGMADAGADEDTAVEGRVAARKMSSTSKLDKSASRRYSNARSGKDAAMRASSIMRGIW
jgi:hypothetical protein